MSGEHLLYIALVAAIFGVRWLVRASRLRRARHTADDASAWMRGLTDAEYIDYLLGMDLDDP